MNMHIAALETILNKAEVPPATSANEKVAVEARVRTLCTLYRREKQKNEELQALVSTLTEALNENRAGNHRRVGTNTA